MLGNGRGKRTPFPIAFSTSTSVPFAHVCSPSPPLGPGVAACGGGPRDVGGRRRRVVCEVGLGISTLTQNKTEEAEGERGTQTPLVTALTLRALILAMLFHTHTGTQSARWSTSADCTRCAMQRGWRAQGRGWWRCCSRTLGPCLSGR